MLFPVQLVPFKGVRELVEIGYETPTSAETFDICRGKKSFQKDGLLFGYGNASGQFCTGLPIFREPIAT